MKQILICVACISLMIAIGVFAQTSAEKSPILDHDTSQMASPQPTSEPAANAVPTPTATPASAIAPRKYPIAAGVWYPGQPLPEKPFRYYRVRCWPGCHHGSRYAKYPNEPVPGPKTPTSDASMKK